MKTAKEQPARVPSERGINVRNLPLGTRELIAKKAAQMRLSFEAFLRMWIIENLK